jgi:membrane-bound inhibitor of C-type lysozyme
MTAILLVMAAAADGMAQTASAQPQDIEFKVVNATTGEPATVERITIEYVTARPNGVADFAPDGAEFTASDVPLKDGGKYYVTVWRQGVPYWWEKRGHQLVAEPNVLYVFDVVSDLPDVVLSGLNLVVRHTESLLQLEYLLQVNNTARPQVVVKNSPATFAIELPPEAMEIEASYARGPEPTVVPVSRVGGGRVGLDLPLTPGINQIRLTARLPWTEGMEFKVGSDLAVSEWSVLASPASLQVTAMELEENDEKAVTGYRRFVGPALAGGESLTLRLKSAAAAAGEPEDLFADEGTDSGAETTETAAEESGSLRLPLLFLALVLIVVIFAAVKRR